CARPTGATLDAIADEEGLPPARVRQRVSRLRWMGRCPRYRSQRCPMLLAERRWLSPTRCSSCRRARARLSTRLLQEHLSHVQLSEDRSDLAAIVPGSGRGNRSFLQSAHLSRRSPAAVPGGARSRRWRPLVFGVARQAPCRATPKTIARNVTRCS